jgi:hypothetical protein
MKHGYLYVVIQYETEKAEGERICIPERGELVLGLSEIKPNFRHDAGHTHGRKSGLVPKPKRVCNSSIILGELLLIRK